MTKLLGSKTYLNLAKAFAGECQARTRYEFMKYGMENEGLKAMGLLMSNVIYNEFNHARMLYSYIQTATDDTIENIDICSGYPFRQKWDVLENLKLSIEDETNEAEKIYPEYSKVAQEEGFTEISKLFDDIIQVETCHVKLFTQLYDQMKNGTLYCKDEVVKWKCGDCGYEAEAKASWQQCPLCKAERGHTMLKIEDES